MSILEYANRTGPDFVKKAVMVGYNSDPMLKMLQSRGLVKRVGGTKVRIPRVMGKHSETTEITGTNYTVSLAKGPVEDYLEGDWGKFIKPIILLHLDRDRFTDKESLRQWVQNTSKAAVNSLKNDVLAQWYVGDRTSLKKIGSLNGNRTGLTATGFENGALQFLTPTAQAAAAGTYLGLARREDATDDLDNWFNQFKAFTAIGTDALPAMQEVKIMADSYAEEGAMELGICGQAAHVALDAEIKSSPSAGGQASVTYTLDDIEKGKVGKPIHIWNGIQFHSNRWMTAARMAPQLEPIYLLNITDALEYWVNANNDFKVGRFVDMLEVNATDADVAMCTLEIQIGLRNLLTCGAVSR